MPKETQEEQERRHRREREQLAPDRVLVGHIEFFTSAVRRCLVETSFYMYYDAQTDEVRFTAPDVGLLFQLKNISLESATRLAEGLGLKKEPEAPTHLGVVAQFVSWGRYVPPIHKMALWHDGSKEADEVLLELVKLGVPHELKLGSEKFELIDYNRYALSGTGDHKEILRVIRIRAGQHETKEVCKK